MGKLLCLLLLPLIFLFHATEGLKCYKCDSFKDKNCGGHLTDFHLEECSANEDSCFTLYFSNPRGGDRISRGCLNAGSQCLGSMCRKCNQNGCNTNIMCYECATGSILNCSVSTAMVTCPNGGDKCITLLDVDENFQRKCADSEIECDGHEVKACEICDKPFCNNPFRPFPIDRRSCYQCTENDPDCRQLKYINPKSCKIYDENDKCYTIDVSNKKMRRGCMSDPDVECSKKTCISCTGDNCNNRIYKRPPSRKCIQCELNEENCSQEAILCKKPIEYWKEEEECFTQIVDGKIWQGCVNDRKVGQEQCNIENTCVMCNDDGCNFVFGKK